MCSCKKKNTEISYVPLNGNILQKYYTISQPGYFIIPDETGMKVLAAHSLVGDTTLLEGGAPHYNLVKVQL